MERDPAFEVRVESDAEPGGTVLVGAADVGLAGLTAVDYLVTHGAFDEVGYVRTHDLPDITPFADGEPRRPIRIYDARRHDLTVLVSELFVPVYVADRFADAVAGWATEHGVETVASVFGTPFPHREEEHSVFHVGTEAFRERLAAAETDIPPLAGGFFDGVVSELLTRSMDDGAPAGGVLVTPSHPPGPDIDGALLLLDAVESVFGVSVDEAELERRSAEMKEYYQQLSDRLRTLQEGESGIGGRDFPEDRMYM